MIEENRNIRIALPSKGLLSDGSRELFARVGFRIYNPNPRQYKATIPRLSGVDIKIALWG